MKREWDDGAPNGPDLPCDSQLYFDNVNVAEVSLYVDWWEVVFSCCMSNEYPDGARFRTRRAAKLYATKHATVMWIGGRYKEQ